MERLLSKIVDNTSKIEKNTRHKASKTFIVSGKSSHISQSFNPTMKLEGMYEIALVNLETWYSFPNVDDNNNNLCYSTDNGETWNNIFISTGSYELTQLNLEIERQMQEKNHYDLENDVSYISLGANIATLKCTLQITHNNYQVDFTTKNSICNLLGFTPQRLTKGYHISENIINILNINSIFVNISIIEGSYINGEQQPTIFSFFPSVAPGEKILVNPKNLLYSRVITDKISDIDVWLTDQDGNPIDLRGESLTIRFHIREM